jgi:hypothetical protein
MLKDDPLLKRQYRMPRVFGALPGPRNVPKDKQALRNNQVSLMLSVTAASTAEALTELLPPDCALDGTPRFTVAVSFLSNIGWLAGHGYAVVTIAIPIQHESKSQGVLTGNFLPVIWENLTDPILTGREELGWAKLYADIPDPVVLGDRYSMQALWKGFRFLELELHDLVDLPEPIAAAPGQFHFKYIPRTGALGDPDVQYLEYSPPGVPVAGYSLSHVSLRQSGKGSFRFHRARWEDMPFQYPIINALAALPMGEVLMASVVRMESREAIGDPSAGALRPTD